MATIKQRLHRKNSSNTYDTIHLETSADLITGTLPVSHGGTGMTTNPSLAVNLASGSAAGVFAASPRPGVTGTLPIVRGGTGATTAANARTALGAAATNHNHDSRYYTETEVNIKIQEVKDMVSVSLRTAELLRTGSCNYNSSPSSDQWITLVNDLPSTNPDFMRIITLYQYLNNADYRVAKGQEYFLFRSDNDNNAIRIPPTGSGVHITDGLVWYHGTMLQIKGVNYSEAVNYFVSLIFSYEVYKYV